MRVALHRYSLSTETGRSLLWKPSLPATCSCLAIKSILIQNNDLSCVLLSILSFPRQTEWIGWFEPGTEILLDASFAVSGSGNSIIPKT